MPGVQVNLVLRAVQAETDGSFGGTAVKVIDEQGLYLYGDTPLRVYEIYGVLLGLSSVTVLDCSFWRVTEMVLAAGTPGKTRGRIQIGAADPSLTGAGGMIAVTELCGKLGLTAALDEGIGPVSSGRGGSPAGRC